MLRPAMLALAAAGGLCLAWPALAQLGAATQSPPPEGLSEGQGAGFAKGHYAALDALPDWGGIWFLDRPAPGSPSPGQPKLQGDYLKRYQDWRQEVANNNGVVKKQGSNCTPPGMPRIMRLAQYPYEFLFTPGRVTINQEAWMQTRTIWTDGREHPPLEEVDPTFMGDSIGHWEGDTLVVDTIGISDELDVDTGVPHSDEFHLVERIHLVGPDTLENAMTMTDPKAFAEPYQVTARYRRDRNGSLIEFECAQNDRNPINDEGETEYLPAGE